MGRRQGSSISRANIRPSDKSTLTGMIVILSEKAHHGPGASGSYSPGVCFSLTCSDIGQLPDMGCGALTPLWEPRSKAKRRCSRAVSLLQYSR